MPTCVAHWCAFGQQQRALYQRSITFIKNNHRSFSFITIHLSTNCTETLYSGMKRDTTLMTFDTWLWNRSGFVQVCCHYEVNSTTWAEWFANDSWYADADKECVHLYLTISTQLWMFSEPCWCNTAHEGAWKWWSNCDCTRHRVLLHALATVFHLQWGVQCWLQRGVSNVS